MQIKRVSQNKIINRIVTEIDLKVSCLLQLESKEIPLNITISYEDVLNDEKYLTSISINKYEPWDKDKADYLELADYLNDCIIEICPGIVGGSEQLIDLVNLLLEKNTIINLWDDN